MKIQSSLILTLQNENNEEEKTVHEHTGSDPEFFKCGLILSLGCRMNGACPKNVSI